MNQLPRERFNMEFKNLSKRDILNSYDPFVAMSSDELTPFELENILNEDAEPTDIKFRNNNTGQNNINTNKVKNNINLPAVNYNK